jgi:hypothetical protein
MPPSARPSHAIPNWEEAIMRILSSKLMGAVAPALTFGLMSFMPGAGFSAPMHAGGHNALHASDAAALHSAMRELWEDHVLWTRLVIVSTAANLPDLDATTQRLLQNQTDIGNAVKPYYGDAAGDKLTALLREHIIGAAELLAAAKANDSNRLDTAKKAWSANGDEIAAFLSGANPKHWPLADMQTMMRGHLDLTLTEAVDQLQGRYAQSVADYDRVKAEILNMSDMLSDGLVKQFAKTGK